MEKAILLAIAASFCTATASVCRCTGGGLRGTSPLASGTTATAQPGASAISRSAPIAL